MIKRFKNSKGITLIALVITIIVLLILAGVAISMLSGENGILKQAAEAKTETEIKSTREAIKLGAIAAMTNKNHIIEDADKLEEALNEQDLKITGNVDGSKEEVYRAKINDKDYVITPQGEVIPVEKDVTKLTKKVEENTMYEDETALKTATKQALIPKGFKVSSDTEEQKIDTGLVVIAPDGSEFVWVPVDDVIFDETTTIEVGTYTPMAILQSGTTNYQGVSYDLNKASGSQEVYNLATYGVGTTNYREPSLVTGSDKDTYAEMAKVTGEQYDNGTDSTTGKKYYELAGNYSSAIEFGKDMQDEYNNMVVSVNKYKGFYVGRYETGIENGKAVSKNAYTNENVTTADAKDEANLGTKSWYGLYNKQRTMAKDNQYIGVESSMIWGSQYDAMMNWMIKTDPINNIVGTGYASSKWTKDIKITGQSENDIINKVHDLYGCHYEWTLEASSTNIRVNRGGDYFTSISPSDRGGDLPLTSYDYNSSRLTLYVR